MRKLYNDFNVGNFAFLNLMFSHGRYSSSFILCETKDSLLKVISTNPTYLCVSKKDGKIIITIQGDDTVHTVSISQSNKRSTDYFHKESNKPINMKRVMQSYKDLLETK